MGGTEVPAATRICPYCREPTRAGWPLCDGCARTLPAERPLPDLRLMNELQRWDRANPRPRDAAALTRRALGWTWCVTIALFVLDLRFGRHIGPSISPWDELAVGALVVALAATFLAVFLLAYLAGRDRAPAWRRERAVLRRRLGIGGPPER